MVGLVVVSHSATLADGVAELAREMAGGEVAIETAGGLEPPEEALGTDATRVAAAIERADSGDGVVVLMDLGSAVLSAELALDLIDQGLRERVVLTPAPLVEGAVAAVVTARTGAAAADVAREAETGLGAKTAQLEPMEPQGGEAQPAPAAGEDGQTATVTVTNPLGLHARPAARLVATAAAWDAQVRLENASTGRGPADARSLSAVAGLGARQGHELRVAASGAQAAEALEAIVELAGRGFDDEEPAAPATAQQAPAASVEEGVLAGLAASPGIAVGPLRHLRLAEVAVPDGPAGADELERLDAALAAVGAELARTREAVAARAGDAEAAIFDAHRLLLEDPAVLDDARAEIAGGRNAAAAYAAAAGRAAAAWRGLEDDYLRARAADVDAVADQVVRAVLGVEGTPALTGAGIVAAADLTPAQTAALDPALVSGIATAAGAPTSHSAILARSLGIPAAVALGEPLLELEDGTLVVLDGDAGTLRADPDAARLGEAREASRRLRARAEAARAHAAESARTSDGVLVAVAANVGSPAEAQAAAAAGADGVGLLRTEFVFLGRDALPDEDEQVAAYREIAGALGGKPVVLRTLDVGADKPLPFLRQPHEANPFLGRRGLRLGLAQPDLLRTQLRAVLRVAAELPLEVMFPMVSTLAELRQATGLLAEAEEELRARGEPRPERLPVGMMVEVPAAALTAAAFASEVDFFSLGTNDLTQYVLAAERGNEHVAALADGLHPAVLRLVAEVAAAGEEGEAAIHVCGELAGDLEAVPLLVGLGVRELSVAPPLVPAVKERVREVSAAEAREVAARALELPGAAEVRALLRDEVPAPAHG